MVIIMIRVTDEPRQVIGATGWCNRTFKLWLLFIIFCGTHWMVLLKVSGIDFLRAVRQFGGQNQSFFWDKSKARSFGPGFLLFLWCCLEG